MKQNGQIQWVKSQLREFGRVSRNDALNRRITRLGAYICDINRLPDWEIKGRWTEGQNDYIYEVVKKPFIPKYVWSEEKRAMVLDNQKSPQGSLIPETTF